MLGVWGVQREHYHPLNITPDCPCTAFFTLMETTSAKDIFDSLIGDVIPASAVRRLQRSHKGKVLITFSKPMYCKKFLECSPFAVCYCLPLSMYLMLHMNFQTRPLNVVYANMVISIKAVEGNSKDFMMSSTASAIYVIHFGKFLVCIYHDGQRKVCRRCGVTDHLAKDCQNLICFN